MKTLAPRDENETVDVVRAALANATPVDVVGSGSRCGLGRPTRAGVQLSTSGLVGVTLYEPSELVLRAKAGTPIQTITALLDEQNQELAFEPIVFGFIARRIKVGGARDHRLLGISTGIAYLSTLVAGFIAFFIASNLLPKLKVGKRA